MARLVVEEERYLFHIYWAFEGDVGGALGQDEHDGHGDPPKDRDDWEHWAACKAVLEMTPAPSRDRVGFVWDDAKKAHAALRVARAALKFERLMPDWAKTAIANGWKPPKGWKP